MNFCGWPKLGSTAAMRFHVSQPLPFLSAGLKPAGVFWLPSVVDSTRPPFVMNTKSSSVSLIVFVSLFLRSVMTSVFAVFLFGVEYGLRGNAPFSACARRISSIATFVYSRLGPISLSLTSNVTSSTEVCMWNCTPCALR